MDYKSIVFREFTPESLERIKRYQQEEAERIAAENLELEEAHDSQNHDHRRASKTSVHKPPAFKRMPNRELAVGETLPRVLQERFPDELIGKPIEDIDVYYRTEYVCIISLFFSF